jgi:hypothetical protein
MAIPNVIGVNPLQTTLLELGIVSGRVALLLRSAEIQPVFEDLYNINTHIGYPSTTTTTTTTVEASMKVGQVSMCLGW